ncbi:MAG: hypothetical protein MK538_07610 [Planctomycetes bacterium]|nr:hypothetical protein [Planctomycetota bacterium]
MRTIIVSSAVLLLAATAMTAHAKTKSGLQPGEKVGAFNVLDSTGPNKGKKLCYR